MVRLTQNRSKLLIGCGSAALAMALVAAPQSARAQAIQATHTDVVGGITRTDTGTGTETITVNAPVTVVDWTPDEISGTALDFLPTGNTVTFQNSVNITDFALLSRILPSTNNDIVVFDGSVISQLIDPATGGVAGPGGTLAFYSPTGIFVGPSATFDVGNLVLTTLDPDLASFDDFVQNGGQLQLTGATGTTAPIIITAPLGGGIVASPENSYFAVVAAEIQMLGISDVNGSTAFVAGEQVNLTVTNGLFDIQIPVGTSVTTPIVIDGDVGGPSSTGVTGDNHLIYAVAAAQTDPISLLLSGNLGFAPAASAGIVNGEIILSANYNVSGRSVDGGSVDGSLGQFFSADSQLTDIQSDIFIEDFISSSSILAIASNEVQVAAVNGPSSIDGNLLAIGRNFAEVTASSDQTFDITGDVFVSARNFGTNGSDISDPTVLDAQGGIAFIDAFNGGIMNIGGSVVVTAEGIAGRDSSINSIGLATGGEASIAATGGTLSILGSAEIRAGARGLFTGNFEIGNDAIGGLAQLFTIQGGSIDIAGDLNIRSSSSGVDSRTDIASTGSSAFGGTSLVTTSDGSAISVGGTTIIEANAFAGTSNESGQGALADAGNALVIVNDDGSIDFGNSVFLLARAEGAQNTGGQGGEALGGAARAVVESPGGQITVNGFFSASANAQGGDGIGGGDAFGGVAGAIAELGLIDIAGGGSATVLAQGGNANQGFGGLGGTGTGGLSFFQATGTVTDTAELNIGGSAFLESTGRGGAGGNGDGDAIAPGRGGDGIGGQFETLNQADPNFGNGAFLLGGGDNGNLTVAGASNVFNFGIGGIGGSGGPGQDGADGGDGIGGTAQFGSSLLDGDGSVGAGTVNVGDVILFANGDGGFGGLGNGTGSIDGNGGDGTGFGAFFTARAGTVNAGNVDLNADGTGGGGHVGGIGTGGLASMQGNFGANVTLTGLQGFAIGRGGFGDNQGGDGIGGEVNVANSGFDLTVNGSLFYSAGATGGVVGNGLGGNATAGIAQIFLNTDESSVTITGNANLNATADGAQSNSAAQGGNATGGTSIVTVNGQSVMSVGGSLTVLASAFGGANNGLGLGGDAVGGFRAFSFVDNGGILNAAGGYFAEATANAGAGNGGGDAFGGVSGAQVRNGTINIGGNVFVDSSARGGEAPSPSGFGGAGGNAQGGLAAIFADGTQTDTGTIAITGSATVVANAFGGTGGLGDGDTIAPGQGGDAFAGSLDLPIEADPNENGGAYITAGGDNGVLTVGGSTFVEASGNGGLGGSGGGTGQAGARGGDGLGGEAQIGTGFFGPGDGSVGNGSATFSDAFLSANGTGGAGGFGGSTEDPRGDGGDGTGNRAGASGAAGGTLNANQLSTIAIGFGGEGANGGIGTGGSLAGLFTNSGGSFNVGSYTAEASGFGGTGLGGVGGIGQGGQAFIGFQDGTGVVTGDALIDASGTGGSSSEGDGADGTGGLADIAIFNPIAGTGTIGGNTQVLANGFGGEGASGFVGGTGTGGEAFVQAQSGGSITFNSLSVSAGGQGGAGAGAIGGNGFGGLAEILSFDAGSQIIVQNSTQTSVGGVTQGRSLIAANGVGGETSGGTGLGGTGTGGEAVLSASNGGSIILATDDPFGNRITARGLGGNSLVDGGSGGTGVGGIGRIDVDGGTIDAGLMLFSVFGGGFLGFGNTLNIDGGDGIGGERHVSVTNGGELTIELFGGVAGGLGGEGSGTGNGGNASGGLATLLVEDSTVNFVGRSIIANQVSGGGGFNGGNATAGSVDVSITGSTINILPNANGDARLLFGSNAFGGAANGGSTAIGGSAIGGATNVSITDSTINGGTLVVAATANGGTGFEELPGQGGDATGGALTVDILNSALDLVTAEDTTAFNFDPNTGEQTEVTVPGEINRFEATARGGDGIISGSATGGSVTVNLVNSSLSIGPSSNQAGNFAVSASATAGNGQSEMGDARGGSVEFYSGDGIINLDEMTVSADATAAADPANPTGVPAIGGFADAGSAEVTFDTDTVANLAQLVVSAQAQTSLGDSAIGGRATLFLTDPAQTSPEIEIVNVDLNANATGGNPGSNFAGVFRYEATAGQLFVQNMTGTALGDTLPGEQGPSSIIANGGDIFVSGNLFVDVFDNFVVRTGSGSIIGGPSVLSPTAMINITSQGTVSIFGDNDNVISFGGSSLNIASRDIEIFEGARIGAFSMNFDSLNDEDPAILGGANGPINTSDDEGYELSQEEIARLEVGSFSFFQDQLVGAGPNDPSLIIRDATIVGSLDDGVSRVELDVNGIVRIEGVVAVIDAGVEDSFTIDGDERIEIVTPGGIGIVDPDGLPTGFLGLEARNIWVGDADLIAQLQADPNFSGRNELLSVAAAGSDNPLGYLRGGLVLLEVEESLLVRNTGTSTAPGGILVGSDGLIIEADLEDAPPGGADVFAYGARIDDQGNLIVGEAFFSEVDFNIDEGSEVPSAYTDESQFNNCLINTGECSVVVTPPPPPPPPDPEPEPEPEPPTNEESPDPVIVSVNNPSVVEAAISTTQPIETTEQESNEDFGIDFPGLVESEDVEEEDDIEDPVASGGDSSLYGQGNSGNVRVEGK